MKVLWGDYDLMGTNPASVNMQTGDILLNMNVFPYLDPFTQKMIVEHEKAHFDLQTDSEEEADRTALKKLYKTESRSLKKGVKALADFLGDDDNRIETIYNEALKIDKGMDNNLFRNRRSPFNFRNADGSDDGVGGGEGGGENPPAEGGRRGWQRGDGTNRRFVSMGGYVFSVGELAIVACLLILIFNKK